MKIIFQKTEGKVSVNVRDIFVFAINKLCINRMLMPYLEMLSPCFLPTDLASSVRTLKPRA